MINFLDELSPDFSYMKMEREDIMKWVGVAEYFRTEALPKNPCLSRQIGCIIVDPYTNTQMSAGHNGPPTGTPCCDDEEYLRDVLWPQLTDAERGTALMNIEGFSFYKKQDEPQLKEMFCDKFAGCAQCPRRLIGAPSGQRLELCTCAHGETTAIVRAHRSVVDMTMFCACGVPCIDCTKLILESRLSSVFCVVPDDKGPEADYSPYVSRWLFEKSVDTDLYIGTPEWFGLKL